jgi:tetratricopeptide (TPR) repeat protein
VTSLNHQPEAQHPKSSAIHKLVDSELADFLESFARLCNINASAKVMTEVIERYLPYVNRLGDDARVVFIRHHYAIALVWTIRYLEAVAIQRETLRMAHDLGNSKSRAYAVTSELYISTTFAPKSLDEFQAIRSEAIKSATESGEPYIQTWARFAIAYEEIYRGRMNNARDVARALMETGRSVNDPRSTGTGLVLLSLIALASDAYADAFEYSERALEVAITPLDRSTALVSKIVALILLRRVEDGKNRLREFHREASTSGLLLFLANSEFMIGLCDALEGNLATGVRQIEDAIRRQTDEGNERVADWIRLYLSEVYLQILAGEEKPSLAILISNLPFLLKTMIFAPSRIRALMERVLKNSHFDTEGHYIGRARMILGMLYKIKRNKMLAVQHLAEAQRILGQFGETPILARVETALSELRQ